MKSDSWPPLAQGPRRPNGPGRKAGLEDGALFRHVTAPEPPARLASLARRLLFATANRQDEGLEIVEEGRTHRLGAGVPVARVTVHDQRAYIALLRSASVGLGTSYVNGWWDADDLTAVVQLLIRWTQPWRRWLDATGNTTRILPDSFWPSGAPNRAVDRRNIQAHYDLSNEFFELMLDQSMTYSCALFEDEGSSLHQAQETKIDRLCRKLDLQPDENLVEIGSGWGALALHAASRYGCRVTTTTISEAQHSYVAKRVAEAGLTGRVTILSDDWRDLRGRFDKLISVEMIEAVDWRQHDQFVARCADLLTSNGLAVIQAIVIDDHSFERAKRHQDFIRKMIFPGGCLPSVASLSASLARATDLRIIDLEDIGRHYAETLRRWSANLAAHETDVQHLGVSPEFRRLWALYLSYCEAAFLERHVSDVQLLVAKPAWRGSLHPRAR